MDVTLDHVRINFTPETLWVLNLVLAFVMFGIALEISLDDFKRLFKNPKPVLVGVFSQFVLLPLVTFLFIITIEPAPSIALGMLMVAACPGGNVSNFMTHLAKGNAALSVCLTAIATLLAVFMTPLNLQIWGSLYDPTAQLLNKVAINPWEMIKLVSLLLAVPLVLGMAFNHQWPKMAARMAKYFKSGSLLFFIVLVFLALSKNGEIFENYILYVFWLVVAHNILAYLTGFSLARLVGLESRNVRTITIETGIQNSGLGLLLIFTFFEGLGGMALLTAFWAVWHLVTGLLLGLFWSRRPTEK